MNEAWSSNDSLISLAFSVQANPGAYALLLGAGVSAESGMPTAWEVLADLTRRVAELSGEADLEDPVAWYEGQFGEKAEYETLLERLAQTPDERQRLLRQYFEPVQGDSTPDPTLASAHHSIARLVGLGAIRVIVTLNFDRLIENAIRDVGIEPTVVSTPADAAGLAPLHTLDCCVVHLHGDYLNAGSMLNTLNELASYDPNVRRLITRVLEDYGLVIAGWSSDYDPALREAISQSYPRRYSMAWLDPNPQSELGADLLAAKQGLLVRATAKDGFGWLSDAVASLDKRQSRHPLTVPIAIEIAKKDLAGERVAIDLHDELGREFSALHGIPEFHLDSYDSAQSHGGYQALADRVRESTRVCAALTATMAYWGNTETDAWWFPEIERLSQPIRGGGETRLLALRQIAACVLFYSAGISALAGNRFDLLAKLLTSETEGFLYDEEDLLAYSLSADRQFPGLENPVGILKDTIDPILREVLSFGNGKFEIAWQGFELLKLGAIAVADGRLEQPATTIEEVTRKMLSLSEQLRAESTDDEARKGLEKALEQGKSIERKALSEISSFAYVGRPHIFMEDRGPENGFQSPAARQLIADLLAEGKNHPLVQASPGARFDRMSSALRGVQIAGGNVAREIAYSKLTGMAGIVPNEIWLDTGEAGS